MKNKYVSKTEIKTDVDFYQALSGWTILHVGITKQSLERFEDKTRYRSCIEGGLTFFLEREVAGIMQYKKVVLDTITFDTIVACDEIIEPFTFGDHMEVLPTDSELLKEIKEGLDKEVD